MVRSILWVYSVGAAATAVIGVQAYVALGPAADIRATALEDQNPAQFAAVLLPAVIFGLYELVAGERRLLGGAIAFVTTVGVVVSGTRGAWLGLAIVVVLFILPKLQLKRQVMAIAAAVLIGAVTLQIPGVANLVVERTVTAVSSGGAGRTDIWTVGFSIYQSTPVLGVGYANFPVAYTGQAVRDAEVSTGHGVNRGPHNLVIGTLTELGPIGLVLLAAFLLPLVVRQGWGPYGATVQASLASLLLLALFLDILGNRKQVWLIIGLAVGLGYLRRKARDALAAGEAPVPDNHPRPVAGAGAGVGAKALKVEPGSTE
jgi:exopolysaccharide production protein ExoQ